MNLVTSRHVRNLPFFNALKGAETPKLQCDLHKSEIIPKQTHDAESGFGPVEIRTLAQLALKNLYDDSKWPLEQEGNPDIRLKMTLSP